MQPSEISSVLAAIADLKLDLAVVSNKVTNIECHLDKLNSKVSAQELAVGELKLHQAERMAQCPMINDVRDEIKPIHDHMVELKAKAESDSTWINRMSPALWAVAGMLVTLLLSHGKELLASGPGK